MVWSERLADLEVLRLRAELRHSERRAEAQAAAILSDSLYEESELLAQWVADLQRQTEGLEAWIAEGGSLQDPPEDLALLPPCAAWLWDGKQDDTQMYDQRMVSKASPTPTKTLSFDGTGCHPFPWQACSPVAVRPPAPQPDPMAGLLPVPGRPANSVCDPALARMQLHAGGPTSSDTAPDVHGDSRPCQPSMQVAHAGTQTAWAACDASMQSEPANPAPMSDAAMQTDTRPPTQEAAVQAQPCMQHQASQHGGPAAAADAATQATQATPAASDAAVQAVPMVVVHTVATQAGPDVAMGASPVAVAAAGCGDGPRTLTGRLQQAMLEAAQERSRSRSLEMEVKQLQARLAALERALHDASQGARAAAAAAAAAPPPQPQPPSWAASCQADHPLQPHPLSRPASRSASDSGTGSGEPVGKQRTLVARQPPIEVELVSVVCHCAPSPTAERRPAAATTTGPLELDVRNSRWLDQLQGAVGRKAGTAAMGGGAAGVGDVPDDCNGWQGSDARDQGL